MCFDMTIWPWYSVQTKCHQLCVCMNPNCNRFHQWCMTIFNQLCILTISTELMREMQKYLVCQHYDAKRNHCYATRRRNNLCCQGNCTQMWAAIAWMEVWTHVNFWKIRWNGKVIPHFQKIRKNEKILEAFRDSKAPDMGIYTHIRCFVFLEWFRCF